MFAFVVVRQNRLKSLANQRLEPTSTQVAKLPPPVEPTPANPEPQPPGPGELPPGVQEAQRRVDENSEDPVAHLDLALAFWDAGMQHPAYETLNHAADLAGGDRGFLIEAGNQFHMREAWIASAAMYLRFIKSAGTRGEVPNEILNNFHEAVYMAAPQPELDVTYPLVEEIMKVDQPIGLVAQSRFAYHNGRVDEARALLDQAKRLKPGSPETSLLEAEYAMAEKRFEEAKLILEPLVADPNVPEWIRVMAVEFIDHIP
jgi:predicted Zn-dependent protease